MIAATGPWCTNVSCGICTGKTYTYDKSGNRLCKAEAGTATSYSYASGTNRVASSSGGESASYSYNANGSITGDGAHTYQYSDASRLATVDDAATATYIYDGENRRVEKSSGGGRTLYFYDPNGQLLTEVLLGETGGSGLGKDYIYLDGASIGRVDWLIQDNWGECPPGLGTGDCDPVAATADLYFYHTDHLGTPIAMTDGGGSIWWQAEPRPFGDIVETPANSDRNNLRFPGQYFDSETGLHQNWFRDYSPRTGRYREADPIGFGGGVNAYGYADFSPTNATDPFGLCAALAKGASVAGYDPCKDPKYAPRIAFLRAHLADSQLLATLNATRPEFVLAQSYNESTWGTTALARQGGNYFGSKFGSFFKTYRIGTFINPIDNGPYNQYALQNAFLDSGASMFLGFHGTRLYGSQTIDEYIRALTTVPLAFNSTKAYPNAIRTSYQEVLWLLPCVSAP